MKKKRSPNRKNESLNNKDFPIIPKQTNQVNKNIFSQRKYNKNIINPNDSILDENFSSLIDLWNDLGVTNKFRYQFNKSLYPLSNEEKEISIKNEIKNLNKFRKNLMKFTDDVTQREKNIQLLREYDKKVKSVFLKGAKKLNNSNLNDIIKIIEELRYNSINCVNSLIKVRELSYYKSLKGKYNFNKMNKNYIYNNDYLIKMKNDMNFLRNSYMGNYIDFTNGEIDPFLTCCSPKNNNRNRRQDKISIPINDDLMKGIKQAKNYYNQDIISFNSDEDTKIIKNNISFNKFSSNNSFINKFKRVNYMKRQNSAFNIRGNFKKINVNNLNMNKTLHNLKVRSGEEKYNILFLNREQNFFKKKQLKKNMNKTISNFQRKNENNNYRYDIYHNEDLSKNKIKIKRKETPLLSRGEFFKRLYDIGKEKKEYNIDSLIAKFKKRFQFLPSNSDYLDSKKFVESNKTKIINKMNIFTNNISEEEIIEAQINNPINHERRNLLLEEISNTLIHKKLTEQEYYNSLIILGINIKFKIIYEIYNYPEQFIPLKEAEKAEENTTLFMKGILSKLLMNNNITVAIKKDYIKEDNSIALSLLQSISTGDAFKKLITITYNINEKKNPLFFTDENVQKQFLNKKIKQYSHALQIPEKNINMLKIGHKLYTLEISNDKKEKEKEREIKHEDQKTLKKKLLKEKEPVQYKSFHLVSRRYIEDSKKVNEEEKEEKEEEEEKEEKILKHSDEEIFDLTFNSLLAGCGLTENMFNKKGNKINKYNWGKHKSRGPPNYLQEYIPPIGYIGFGLLSSRQYDNGDDAWLGCDNNEGEWYIAYHGTGNNDAIGKIITMGLIPGQNQDYYDEENINELSKKNFPLCGRGVYLSPDFEEAEIYSENKKGIFLNDIQYNIIFMCRVNPFKIRIANKDDPAFWVVGGDSSNNNNGYKIFEECRPYRILLKKTEDDEDEYTES